MVFQLSRLLACRHQLEVQRAATELILFHLDITLQHGSSRNQQDRYNMSESSSLELGTTSIMQWALSAPETKN